MTVPLLHDPAAAQKFLLNCNVRAMREGRNYFKKDYVQSIVGNSAGTDYSAEIWTGTVRTVTLTYRDEDWHDTCTCKNSRCAHSYALMLRLFDRSRPFAVQGDNDVTALRRRLTETLDRPLKPDENSYVRTVEKIYGLCKPTGRISLWQLQPLTGQYGSSWDYPTLWKKFPADSFQFWNSLSTYLRKNNVAFPPFMGSVLDLEALDREVAALKRKADIEEWSKRLQSDREAAAPLGQSIDLRIVITPPQARFEWRRGTEETWTVITTAASQGFADSHEQGLLLVCPDAFALWQVLFQLAKYGAHVPGALPLASPTVGRAIGQLFRLPALRERLLNPQLQPFLFSPETLVWKLQEPGNASGDYRLQLALPDGTLLAPPLAILPGAPPLYLSETTAYLCPHVHADDSFALAGAAIPAGALDSAPGVRFLLRVGANLTPQMTARVRTATMKVRISCSLVALQGRQSGEFAHIKVLAESDSDGRQEVLTPEGWALQAEARPRKEKIRSIVVSYDRAALGVFPAAWNTLSPQWDIYKAHWRMRVTKTFAEQFLAWLDSLPKEIEVSLDRELESLRGAAVSGAIKLNCEAVGVDWFDLSVVLDVSDTELTPDEVKALLDARGGFVRLGAKGWRRLQLDTTAEENEQLARLGLSTGDFSAEPQRLHALQLADPAAARFLPEDQVELLRRRAGELKMRVSPPVPPAITGQLRPYQVEGFHFLAYLTSNNFGGVLADDMGLGKTLQTLAWLAWLRTLPQSKAKPILIVCPKSVMDNWLSETARFYSSLRVYLYRAGTFNSWPEVIAAHDLIVVNYAQLRTLSDDLTKIEFSAVVLDEGQYIKNPSSQTAQVARSLKADYRLALSGTPIENRLLDLWSLMSFAMPGVLGNRHYFARNFDQKGDPLARRRLAARVRPFVLRRTKGQVAKDLPERMEEDLLCEMEGDQEILYRAELKRARQMLLNIKTQKQLAKDRFHFLTSLLRLRQICCHPALVDITKLKAESAKMVALMDVLEPLMEEGHKVLVFSQFVSLLQLLRPVIEEKNWTTFYLAGETEDRGELVQKFQGAPGAAIFLISLKAGGFGLNLTAASYVVLFDPWWNPAVEAQAIDRTHRIGQVNKVIAYRLLIKNSIEEKIRELQRKKNALAQDILGEENFMSSLTLDDFNFLFSEQ